MKHALTPCALLLLSSCGEALTDSGTGAETPVVESYLQEGATNLTVKVYTMEAYLKDGYRLSKPVGGLSVTVNGRELTETSAGAYSLDLGRDSIRENQEYALRFTYGGREIEASTTVPAPVRNLRVEPATLTLASYSYWDMADTSEVVVSWDDPSGSYYQVYIESPNTADMPSLGQFGQRMMQPFRGNTYRTSPRDFRSPGAHRICIYRVGRDYADLYERISSSDLSSPVSAIRNAYGIFTSHSVAQTQVWVSEAD